MSDERDAEELLQNSKANTRVSGSTAEPPSLDDAVAEALQRVDDGDLSSNLTMRDDRLAALFAALDETGELKELNDTLHDRLDLEERRSVSKSNVLSMLVRVGLQETDPEILDSGREGYQSWLMSQADDF